MEYNQKRIAYLPTRCYWVYGRLESDSGIIKDGAKMVNAVANSTVPKIHLITGNSFGAGNYAMNGTAYGQGLYWLGQTLNYAVMGGAQAAGAFEIEKSRFEDHWEN